MAKQAKNNNLVKTPNHKGRPKGALNKTTSLLKDAILKAAEQAGNEYKDDKGNPTKEGLTGYLKNQAVLNPGPFLALLGKVLPMQVTGEGGEAIKVQTQFIFTAVGPDHEPDHD